MSSLAPMVPRPISPGIAHQDRRRRSPVNLADLVDQAGIIVRYADNIGAMTRGSRPPRHLFEQPGAERVEFAHPGHIDLDDAGGIELRCDVAGKSFERGGIRRRPRSARTQFKGIARWRRR